MPVHLFSGPSSTFPGEYDIRVTDGDGEADILWRNAGTGQTVEWLMDGTSHTSPPA